MAYTQKLKTRSFYRRIFKQVKNVLKESYDSDILVEHVGNTSLTKPAGKGDVDIYVGYRTKTEMRKLKTILIKLFGKPGRTTSERIRFSDYIDGVQVELQLIDLDSVNKAVGLREYFKKYPKEAEEYSKKVQKVRTDSLKKMWQLKSGYIVRAAKFWEKNSNLSV